MQIRKHMSLLAALFAILPIPGPFQAAPHLQAATQDAAQAESRTPGLYMTFQTDKGDIACKLYEEEAPIAVHTMVGLAIGKITYLDPRTKQVTRKRFFDGLTFHRVIPDFMIQGGDPLGDGTGRPIGPGFPYKTESVKSLKFNMPGRLALANAGPKTNGSQFFITEAPRSDLNGDYTIWGQCENLDVVKAIARVKRDLRDKPLTPVFIQHVIVERVGPAPADAPEAMPVAKPSN
jgi:peptidyl-prolyl cis-trans isomerase A (cyclophilin A)